MDISSALFSVDYLNLNETEKFSSELEQIIRTWNLDLDQLETIIDKKDKIKFLKCFNIKFRIILFENDLIAKNDYKQLLNCVLDQVQVTNYYHSNEANFIEQIHGLKNFILIQTDYNLDILESERIIRLINSAISCSITNSKCIYPILVQIKDKALELSTGCYINFGIRVQYDSVIFELNQFNSSTLADFLKIFENKLNRNLQLDDNVRCYLANRRSINDYLIKNDHLNLIKNDHLNLIKNDHLNQLRFQIKHTEILSKIQGTQWTFNADESILKDFNRLECGCLNVQVYQIDQSSIYKSIFYASQLGLSSFTDHSQLKRRTNIDQEYLNYFMIKNDSISNDFIDKNFVQFKSTSFDSIIFRFASFVFEIYSSESSIDEIMAYWTAIVDQLRRYWELTELILCVEVNKAPDLNSCLLTQKIQMLNCCIKEKQRREGSTLNQIKDDEDNDEFFDCQTDQDIDDQAEGRLERLDLTLINNKNKSIYKPITQDLTPYTKDNQDEYLNAYSGLSIEDEVDDQFLIGKNILLFSDMEAFKAANPECCFEDFIHWYSPNDFIDAIYDEQTGQLLIRECLSKRFQSPNCLWKRIWQSSKARPVSKQKRLFNYSMEAERVLEYLSTIKFDELIRHLFSTLVLIGCSKYKQMIDNCEFKSEQLSNYFNQQVKQISDSIDKIDKTSQFLIDLENKVFSHLGLIHLLKEKFNELKDDQLNEVLNEFNDNKFYKIKKDDLGRIVFKGLNRLFDSSEHFSLSKEKEFTFVADCSRPAKYSRKLPQKLNFNVKSSDDFKKFKVQMNGQFVEDIVYF